MVFLVTIGEGRAGRKCYRCSYSPISSYDMGNTSA